MPLEDYVLTLALGGAFSLGLLFIVMRREANVNLQSGMNAEGLLATFWHGFREGQKEP